MLGQVIRLASSKTPGAILGLDDCVYYYTLENQQTLEQISLGAEVEFAEPENDASSILKKLLSKEFVKIINTQAVNYNFEINQTFISNQKNPSNVNILETIKNYDVCGESLSKQQALQEMIYIARACGANAVLNTKLDIFFNPLKKMIMFRYTGNLAQISSLKNNQDDSSSSLNNDIEVKPCLPIHIHKDLIHKSSPNDLLRLHIKTMLIVIMLLALPICGQMILKYNDIVSPSISIFFAILIGIICLVSYINIFPHKNYGYLRKQMH